MKKPKVGGQSYDDGEEESDHLLDVEHPKGESHFPEKKPLRRNSERGDKERGGGHPIHGASRRDGRSPMDQVERLVRGPSARQEERHLSERRLGDKLEGPRIQTKTW